MSRRRYLLAYDIRDERRLRTVHKTMKEFGWSLQYSVFICDLDQMELIALNTELSRIVDHARDSVAIVDLGLPEERGRRCFEFIGVPPRLPTTGPVIL